MSPHFISIFLGTFVLEDAALAASLALVAQGKIPLTEAFLACFLGIGVGDIGVYGWGFLVSILKSKLKWPFLHRLSGKVEKYVKPQSLAYYVFLCRFVPGTRVPTYLCAGFLRFSLLKFTAITIISVFCWVSLAFVGGRSIQLYVSNNWVVSLIAVLFLLHIFKTIIPKLIDPWERKAFFHSWRKWTHFEFWPAWFFYIPVYVYYIYFSLKTRSFFTPFYANPEVYNGGLLGESKWDFLKHLAGNLETHLILAGTKPESIQMPYPFIIKPDVGQRGYGVRIIKNFSELEAYMKEAPFNLIVQELSLLKKEAGLFYIRKPDEQNGFLYSITDKEFPSVTGDGKTKLGDLIIQDKRARIMAAVYFERLREQLDQIPKPGEHIFLSECGNHCQGAIFKNGNYLNTPALEKVVDDIAKKIPHFYFGRFDIRYESAELLKQGRSFRIVEVNGAGAEATHIWDSKTTIFQAYASLYDQWSILFSIGKILKNDKSLKHKVHIMPFFKESFKVFTRKTKLSVSS